MPTYNSESLALPRDLIPAAGRGEYPAEHPLAAENRRLLKQIEAMIHATREAHHTLVGLEPRYRVTAHEIGVLREKIIGLNADVRLRDGVIVELREEISALKKACDCAP